MQPNRNHNFRHRQDHQNPNQNNQQFYNNQKDKDNLPQFAISHNRRNFQNPPQRNFHNQPQRNFQDQHQNNFNR